MLQVICIIKLILFLYFFFISFHVLYRRDQGFSYMNHRDLDHQLNHREQLHHKHSLTQDPSKSPESPSLDGAICDGSLFLCYILPPLLHLSAFIHTIWLLRLTDNEHLQTLFEKVRRVLSPF